MTHLTAQQYRERAEEIRVLAESVRDDNARQGLLAIAEQYEQFAIEAAKREALTPRST